MPYFKDRNKPAREYSSHEEASEKLRDLLFTALNKHVWRGVAVGGGIKWSIDPDELQHELHMELGRDDFREVMYHSPFEEVFTAVEICLKDANSTFSRQDIVEGMFNDVTRAFEKAGSVYTITTEGDVVLKLDENMTKQIQETSEILSTHHSAREKYLTAVQGLTSRKRSPTDIVNDSWIAFEDYTKEITGKGDFDSARKELVRKELISSVQSALLGNLHGFRSNSDGVAHAAENPPPDEIAALWFLESITAQFNLISRRLKPQ